MSGRLAQSSRKGDRRGMRIAPVTQQDRPIAEALEVHPHQSGYIEPVRECLEEADQLSDWRPVGIWEGETMVGFAMYGRIRENGRARVWFDRLLIDRRYQGQGYARGAMEQILALIRDQYPAEDIYLSVYEENEMAIALYQNYGFQFNGELDTKGEKVMVLEAAQRDA